MSYKKLSQLICDGCGKVVVLGEEEAAPEGWVAFPMPRTTMFKDPPTHDVCSRRCAENLLEAYLDRLFSPEPEKHVRKQDEVPLGEIASYGRREAKPFA